YFMGDYSTAESWYDKALPIYRRHVNDSDFDLVQFGGMLSDAAFAQRARGRLDQAEALWREVLTYAPRAPPKYRSGPVVIKTFLAQLYLDRGDVASAEAMASQAVQELRALDNPFPLTEALIDLGDVRRLQHRFSEAESL